jgi:glyoxylase-like metal-dependent hydrolase (beta-lactamase superfamily II)
MDIVVEDPDIRIIRLELGPYNTNSYIIISLATGDSMVIDAPSEAEEILKQLNGTNPRYIALTHNHIDHIGALRRLKSELKIPLAAHPLDTAGLPESLDIKLDDENYLTVGALKIKALHTPGHTPGSMCFLAGRYLLAGDTIFPGGPGYTSSPSDFSQILRSIEKKILSLPADTVIYPGHGNSTVLADEKESIALFISGPHAPGLHGNIVWL